MFIKIGAKKIVVPILMIIFANISDDSEKKNFLSKTKVEKN